jgi:flagellar L-ring protein precursor FlgH
MKSVRHFCLILFLAVASLPCSAGIPKGIKNDKPPETSPLDRYIQEALRGAPASQASSPGSIWTPSSRLTDLGGDVRARQVDDMVTVLVAEHASAVATGVTKTSRQSSLNSSITGLAGITKATGPWANLANLGTTSKLDGEGSTTRSTDLTTTLAARVTRVLPNGYLVIEGAKDVQVNAERQTVIVRGVVRPEDLSPGNVVLSSHVAQLEVHINGKGVVNDAVHRPNILYRILLGLLPF